MQDYLEIGCTPLEEKCLQLGQAEPSQMRQECCIFKRQLERTFNTDLVSFRVKGNAHDFGTYYEVTCYYDTDNEDAVNEAYHAESETPLCWDEIARAELTAAGISHSVRVREK